MPNNQLFTPVKFSSNEVHKNIPLGTKTLCLGSCFSEHLYAYLHTRFWPIFSNPCGITYNPLSISKILNTLCTNSILEQKDIFYHNELWSSFDFHGSFSHPNPDASLDAMNNSIDHGREQFKKTNVVIISFGTAFGYFFKDQITNNCHKLAHTLFDRRHITIDESVHSLSGSIDSLLKIHPNLKIICTVSPIRHLRDSATENSLSKATLRCMCDELVKAYPQNVDYFPSFEIMNDELRDYRFYKRDMIHPTDVAIDIIMGRFVEAYFDTQTHQYISELEPILKSLDHKPKNPNSTSFQEFQRSMKQKISSLKQKYPNLNIYI